MDAEQILSLKPMLAAYLKRFDDCFARKDTRAHLPVYVEGQLSDLPRKSVEPIALHADVAPRTLQEFLSQHAWNHDRMRDRLQALVVAEHASPNAIGIFDETSYVKKGDKTPGVQRQYCGHVGKQENCIVTVHLGYAVGDFHCLLDGELYLPESWAGNRERCGEAGIPDNMTCRPKTEIALELYDRARANGVAFAWLTFDEWYGGKRQFLRALDSRGQLFVAEVPRNFTAWIDAPEVTHRPYRRGRGRGRKTPRLVAGSRAPRSVDSLLHHPALRKKRWRRWHVKDGKKGPMVWEVKHARVFLPDEHGLPSKSWHLIVARNVLDPSEVKFFISNAPPETPLRVLLWVAFSRWRVERCFEDHKGEIGMDHYEGRKYVGLKRHLTISMVSYLFLARARKELGGEKSGVDGVPGAHGGSGVGAVLVAAAACGQEAAGADGAVHPKGTKEKRPSPAKPRQTDAAEVTRIGHQTDHFEALQAGYELAL